MNTEHSADPTASSNPAALLDERSLSRLRWRCRRGLLENDLLIERFFNRFENTLTVYQAQGVNDLMALTDNDLLDLLLRRKNPDQLEASDVRQQANSPAALCVLKMLRPPA